MRIVIQAKPGLASQQQPNPSCKQTGDVLGTNATRTVGNAAKDACNLIVADWQAHGRLNVQEVQRFFVTNSSDRATCGSNFASSASRTRSRWFGVSQPTSALFPVSSTVAILADAAKKRSNARLVRLAKDNPSIICK